jgi:hypothetical protein
MRKYKKITFSKSNDSTSFYLDDRFCAFVRIKPRMRYRQFYKAVYKKRASERRKLPFS